MQIRTNHFRGEIFRIISFIDISERLVYLFYTPLHTHPISFHRNMRSVSFMKRRSWDLYQTRIKQVKFSCSQYFLMSCWQLDQGRDLWWRQNQIIALLFVSSTCLRQRMATCRRPYCVYSFTGRERHGRSRRRTDLDDLDPSTQLTGWNSSLLIGSLPRLIPRYWFMDKTSPSEWRHRSCFESDKWKNPRTINCSA